MKKFVVVSIAAVLVALAVPALAATKRRTYFGPAAGGVNNAGVEISARLTNGTPTKVTKFEWHNVPATCSHSTTATTSQITKTLTVKSRKFSATVPFNSGHATITVSGKFKHSDQRMAGTLRVRGAVPGCGAADTGTVSWTAKQPSGQG